MTLPGMIDLRTADVHLTSDAMLKFGPQLTDSIQMARKQVIDTWT